MSEKSHTDSPDSILDLDFLDFGQLKVHILMSILQDLRDVTTDPHVLSGYYKGGGGYNKGGFYFKGGHAKSRSVPQDDPVVSSPQLSDLVRVIEALTTRVASLEAKLKSSNT